MWVEFIGVSINCIALISATALRMLFNKKFKAEGNPLTPAYRYHKRLHEEQQQMLEQTGLKHLYPDMKEFYLEQQHVHGAANKRMIEAIRSNPHMDGYCVHALTGGDWILGAGLLDLWRNPKSYAYEATKAANHHHDDDHNDNHHAAAVHHW